jgi:hypothetical protein
MKFVAALMALVIGSSAFAGSEGVGGGDLFPHPVKRSSYPTVQCLIEVIPVVVGQLGFEYIERNLVPEQTSSAGEKMTLQILRQKLFHPSSGRPNIYEIVAKLKYDLNENENCFSPEGEVRDASAYTINGEFRICLSYPRLSRRLYQSHKWRQIHALIIHEASHLAGTTEAEAQYLQELAENSDWFLERNVLKTPNGCKLL